MEENFFYWFKEISKIPRGSKNEKAVAERIFDLCQKKGLDVKIDSHYNLVVKKPGSKGYENSPPVILQAHTDMVCEKNEGTVHDFTKDPIKVLETNGWLHADGTTLGADNGIGVAYILSILLDESGEISHPPIEAVLTVSEEIGLLGANAFDNNFFQVQGKKLVNLDSFKENLLTVGCAGAARLRLLYDIKKEAAKSSFSFLRIFVTGLKGGHSGEDTTKGLGNSIVILARVLKHLKKQTPLQLSSFKGGDKFNAIPREAEAIVAVENAEFVKKSVEDFLKEIRFEFDKTDDDLKIEATEAKAGEVFVSELEETLISAFLILPSTVQGVNPFSKENVLLSCNIAPVQEIEGKVEISLLLRGNINSQKEKIVEAVDSFAKLTKASLKRDSDYPAWQFRASSPFRDQATKVYKELYGKELGVYTTHAGLECGILLNKIDKNIEAIAIGTNIVGAHTPEEKLEISSAKRSYGFLLKLLSSLK